MKYEYQYQELEDQHEHAVTAIKNVIEICQDAEISDADARVKIMEWVEEWIY